MRPALELICPGLLGPLPLRPEPFPALPNLDRLLARARPFTDAETDPFVALFAAFGYRGEPGRDLPSAPLCLLGEAPELIAPGAGEDAYWLHADPVYLRPDMERLRLFELERFALTAEETAALVSSFNDHFADEGVELFAPTPQRWYLRLAHPPALVTTPLYRVLGEALSADAISGADALTWTRLLNEVQMLFFADPVNRAREARGVPVVNGLWPWGGGRLPAPPSRGPGLVVGEHPLTYGLARWAGAGHRTPAQWLQDPAVSDRGILVYDDSPWRALHGRDLGAWADALVACDAALGAPVRALRRHRWSEIVLEPCTGMGYRTSAWGLLRWWRRRGLRGHCRLARR
ncbi:phosphoglycerate mutase [Marichromatium bheemlicum]|nr:phosphoglycerate mutase [Marichromatium bheemlicum]